MVFQTTLIGYIGQDASTRNHEGNTCISFSVAHSETYKDKATGEKKELPPVWVECSLWRNDLANFTPYLRKGTLVCVQGKISTRAYTDQKGQVRASLSLRVSEVKLLGGKKDDEQQQSTGQKQDGYTLPASTTPPTNDDMPF